MTVSPSLKTSSKAILADIKLPQSVTVESQYKVGERIGNCAYQFISVVTKSKIVNHVKNIKLITVAVEKFVSTRPTFFQGGRC